MNKTFLNAGLLACSLLAAPAFAASDCEGKAVDKNGKALAGAAKTSSVKKCMSGGASSGTDEAAPKK